MPTEQPPIETESESVTSSNGQESEGSSRFALGVRPWHVAGVLLACAVVGLGLYGLWPVITGQSGEDAAKEDAEAPSSKAQVDVIVAERTDFPLRTRASGHLVPWQRAQLHAEASGPVTERAVQEGDRVKTGALLASFKNREERITLKEARAQLLKARAEFQAKYDGRLAEVTGNASEDSSSAATRQATQAAVSGLTDARQAVERAKLNVQQTRITAPFAGRVANLKVEEGQYIGRGEKVATLLQDRRMKVEVDVLESDVVNLEKGATARVHVPALGPKSDSTAWVDGTVWAINPQVDAKSGTGRVTISIPNPDGRLVSGLYAEARLETKRLQDRLVVPEDAVLVRQGRDLVFIVEQGRAQWSYVELGARSGNYVEITKGAQSGDTIAVGGHFALAHDASVSVDNVRPLELN
jgi:RND family efflux transporter MFP subunit